MSARLLIAMVCLAVSLGCYRSHAPRSGLPNAVWSDESGAAQSSFTLHCRYDSNVAASMHSLGDDWFYSNVAASMHSLGDDWIIWVNAGKVAADSWKIGIQPYPTAADAQRAAEHYANFYSLCPSKRAMPSRKKIDLP